MRNPIMLIASRAPVHMPARGVLVVDTREALPELEPTVRLVQRLLVTAAMEAARGNLRAAAALLDVEPREVRRVLRSMGSEPEPLPARGPVEELEPGVFVVDTREPVDLRALVGDLERRIIRHHTDRAGQQTEAARHLGITKATVSRAYRGVNRRKTPAPVASIAKWADRASLPDCQREHVRQRHEAQMEDELEGGSRAMGVAV